MKRNGVELVILPRESVTTEQFAEDRFGRCAIALDGFVRAPPYRLVYPGGYRLNFDHHNGVNRLSTFSTSGQIMTALKLGLGKHLDGAKVFVNDCDQDVALATWMLLNSHRVVDTSEPLLNRLAWGENVMDMTGGAYPLPKESPLRQTLHWVFEPYERARAKVASMDAAEMLTVLEAVWSRIDDYLMGIGGQGYAHRGAWPDAHFSVLNTAPFAGLWAGSPPTFGMVTEYGQGSRQQIADLYTAFVAVKPVPDNAEGPWFYTIVNTDPFVYFPMERFYPALTANEPPKGRSDPWGGSDLLGGGPRTGSGLPPQRVWAIILETWRKAVETNGR